MNKIKKINLTELYKGISYNTKEFNFKKTKDYVTPFLNQFSNIPCCIEIYAETNREKYLYSKILIKVIIINNLSIKPIFNFTYSINKRIPVYKTYKSYLYENIEFITNNCEYKIDMLKKYNQNFINLNNFSIEEFQNEALSIDDINKKIPKWLYNIKNIIINNEYEIIKLPNKVITTLYDNLKIENKIFYKLELYRIIYNNFIKNKKDISNQFEKMQLINQIYENL